MNNRSLILALSFISLTGCFLDGDVGRNGNTGAQGIQGIQGPQGPQGPAGISCWDLNENNSKDIDTEDTNQDGSVNVNDCIIGSSVTTSQNRQYYSSFEVNSSHFLEIFRYTSFLDGEVIDPIQDGCNVWEWGTNIAGNAILTANNGYVIDVETFPHIYTDLSNVTHYGANDCKNACIAETACIGASYSVIRDNQGAATGVSCQLLGRFPEAAQNSFWFYEHAVPSANRDFYFEGFLSDRASTGVISVCSN